MSQVVDANGQVKLLSLNDIEEFISRNSYVILDFYADWCPPCKETSPLVEELAKIYEGKIAFGKVNVDEDRERAKKEYKLKFIPTFFFYKKQKILFINTTRKDRFSGLKTKEEFTEFIKKYFPKLDEEEK